MADSKTVFLDTSTYLDLIAARERAMNRVRDLDKKIEAAEQFIPAHMRTARTPEALKRERRSRRKKSLAGIIEKATEGELRGVPYSRLREILEAEYSADFNDRAFHRALYNLRKEKRIVSHNEHAFEPSLFSKHQLRVQRGEIDDVVSERNTLSPMTEEIFACLEEAGTWVQSKDILERISKKKEIQLLLSNGTTQFYNTLSRLTGKNQLLKHEPTKSYKIPQPGEEADTESPAEEAGLFADEAATSSDRKPPKEELH